MQADDRRRGVEVSTTPYARRKPKKEKLEDLPVIRLKPVEAPEQEEERGDATRSGLIVPDDATDLDLRLLGTPEKTVSHETVEHKGAEELLSHISDPDAKLPVIHAAPPRPVEVAEEHVATPTQAATIDEIKLGEGDTTLWREAVRPTKKAEDK